MKSTQFPAAEPALANLPGDGPSPGPSNDKAAPPEAYLPGSFALGAAHQIELWRPMFGLTSYTIRVHSHSALMGASCG